MTNMPDTIHYDEMDSPVGTLRLVGSAADFTLLEAVALDTTPPDYRADPRALIRFGIADESTEVEAIGMARSLGAEAA